MYSNIIFCTDTGPLETKKRANRSVPSFSLQYIDKSCCSSFVGGEIIGNLFVGARRDGGEDMTVIFRIAPIRIILLWKGETMSKILRSLSFGGSLALESYEFVFSAQTPISFSFFLPCILCVVSLFVLQIPFFLLQMPPSNTKFYSYVISRSGVPIPRFFCAKFHSFVQIPLCKK